MGYPRVTTGTEAHMVTRAVIRTHTYMVNRVTHMERTLITAKMTITHIEIGMVVHEAARVLIKITHMEHSGTIRVNQTVIRTNMYMVNRVTHMEMALITTKITIAHIEMGVVVREAARVPIGITHMERSGTIKVNQIF